MKTKVWKYCIMTLLLLLALPMQAQKFYNLTAEEVRVDSVLPRFVYSRPLPDNYQDSIYTATVKYAEYVDMTVADIANYNRISGAALPSQVAVDTNVSLCRKKGTLVVSFCPLVFRKNKYQILVSFMLDIKAQPVSRSLAKARQKSRASSTENENSEYAAHSVLASGKWAKIRVPETGVYQLTENVVRQAGFSNINKVKIYGYGGNLQNEALYASELKAQDDLQEVPQCVVGGKHLFYAKGPVSWSSRTASRRTRNPYSDYGYYFITQSDETVETVDSATFVSSFYPSNDFYHSLYEVDGYSWYPGGRNLYDKTPINLGDSLKVIFPNTTGDTKVSLAVNISAGSSGSSAEVRFNGKYVGMQTVSFSSEYNKGSEKEGIYSVTSNGVMDTIVICTLTGLVILLAAPNISYGQAAGAELTISGFTATYGGWVSILTAIAMCCFAFSTIIGWGLYGSRCIEFLGGEKFVRPFLVVYSFVSIVGATMNLGLLWDISDTFNGLMAVPNLIALLMLSGHVKKLAMEVDQAEKDGTI